ncbi:flavin reductase family protein [Nitrospirillum sp. BR 11163]|uniref:flavin reductase family protein n=1 Tax=Nitrospirillum sp. BR 11163 TaxID=3104323 RepID=UPI002AFE59A9|nr:flavin reductase family protein [Nitrospirillum sp. BR 11163]MEA1672799.1 flavin reductase family protein [Nitrospirillum sp. BR 11163]
MSAEELSADFKQAMRRLAASVHIVATRSEGRRFGMTATAVTSLSMAPPSVLVCVNQRAATHPALARHGQIFSVNLLAPGHQDVANRFGTPAEDGDARFNVGGWDETEEGVPILAGAASSLLCAVEGLYPHATHTIVVGRVLRVALGEARCALLYGDGRYSGLS